MEDMKSGKKKVVVHNGPFHLDDVCAVAVLALLFDDNIEIIRTRDENKIATADYVLDVGSKYDGIHFFDHHQESILRDNGVPYAAFGLVWRSFGEVLCDSEEVAKIIDQELVQPSDANDNGVQFFVIRGDLEPFCLHDVIRIFNANWKDKERDDDAIFASLVEFAKGLIAREILRIKARVEGEIIVRKTYLESTDRQILVLDENYGVSDSFFAEFPEILFFVAPYGDRWQAKGVRQNPGNLKLRKNFPKKWAGLRDEELQVVSGVSDAVFCHRNLFMAAAWSKEGAVALAKKALLGRGR